MADTPWRGTPEFEAAVKEWAEETRLPIEEARSQLDDIYRSTPEFVGPSKVVRGPTPHGWSSAVEKSLRLADSGDELKVPKVLGPHEVWAKQDHLGLPHEAKRLHKTFDEIVERTARQLGQSTDHAREALLVMFDDITPLRHRNVLNQLLKELKKAEKDQLLKSISDGLKELEAKHKAKAKTGPVLVEEATERRLPKKSATAEWTGTMDELLEELDEGASSLDGQQQRAARLKAIEEAAGREFPNTRYGPTDWAKRIPDRLSDIGGASEPLPPSMGQHLRGPIESSLRESSNVRRMITPIHPPPQAAPPVPPVPSWTTRAVKALPKAAGAAGSAIGGALWDLGPPIGPTPMSTMGLSILTPEAGGGSDVVTPEDVERSRKFWEDYDARQAAELSKQVRPNPNFQLPVYEPAEVGAR